MTEFLFAQNSAMKARGVIQPTPTDSPEQRERWAQLDALRAQWLAGGPRDIEGINRLSAAIRKEWLEQRRVAR